jgi:hypothetical protein
VTEHGAVTAGKNRCHPPAIPGDGGTTNREDSSADRMQQTALDPMVDGVAPIPQAPKLISRNNPVLSPHQGPYPLRLVI